MIGSNAGGLAIRTFPMATVLVLAAQLGFVALLLLLPVVETAPQRLTEVR